MSWFKRGEPKKEIVYVSPEIAASIVLLVNRGAPYSVIIEKLRKLEEKGYGVDLSRPLVCSSSSRVEDFLGNLRRGGFADDNNRDISLTPAGVRLLEERVFIAYREKPEIIGHLSRDAGLDLDRIKGKYEGRESELSQSS